MKKLILTLNIALASYSSYSQNSNPWPTSGNVGIGTQAPNESLTIAREGVSALGVYRDLNVNSVGPAGQNIDIGARNGTSFTAGAQIQGVLDYPATSGRLFLNTLTGGVISSKLMINSNGNVGIGTTSPGAKLEVNGNIHLSSNENFVLFGTNPAVNPYIQGSSSNNLSIGNNNGPRIMVLNDGNVGIGITSPGTALHVQNSTANTGTLTLGGNTYNGNVDFSAVTGLFQFRNNSAGAGITKYYQFNSDGAPIMTMLKNGYVGIGTTSPDTKLTVNGTIHSTEVKVESSVPAPDYVFEPTYKLTSLEDVKSYVDKNHHLPEIPSAKEIEKDGIKVGDMSMKLLKTIEELTLHVIELNNQVKAQNEKITHLENQLKK